MRRLLFQISGLLFSFFFFGVLFLNEEASVLLLLHLVLALICLVAGLFLGRGRILQDLREAFRRRSIRNVSGLVVESLLFLFIVGLLNWLAYRFNDRIDLTENSIHTLSEDSQGLLQKTPGSFRATVALSPHSKLGMRAQSTLEKFREYLGPRRFEYSFLSPVAYPERLQQLGFQSGDVLMLERSTQSEDSQRIRVKGIGEEALINAFARLSHRSDEVVYFLKGHQEPDIEEDGPFGVSKIARFLREEGYEVESLFLAKTKRIPKGASLLVLVSPKKPLLDAEREVLQEYVSGGGRLLVLGDPGSVGPLNPLLEKFGLRLHPHVVIDESDVRSSGKKKFGMQLLAQKELSHPLFKGTKSDEAFLLNVASSFQVAPNKSSEFRRVLHSGKRSWGETDIQGMFQGKPIARNEDEVQGELPLAFSRQFSRGGTLLAFADSDWILNANIHWFGNRDLIMNSVAWTAGLSNLIRVRPKLLRASSESFAESTLQRLLFFSFLVPEIFILFGLVIWYRRQNLYRIQRRSLESC